MKDNLMGSDSGESFAVLCCLIELPGEFFETCFLGYLTFPRHQNRVFKRSHTGSAFSDIWMSRVRNFNGFEISKVCFLPIPGPANGVKTINRKRNQLKDSALDANKFT